jgi:phage terminase large subunit-like protein
MRSRRTCSRNALGTAGNPVLAMCAANAVVVPDAAGNRKLDKSKATGRIDGLQALAMAEGVEAMMQEAIPVSPWDDPAFSLVKAA